MDESNKGVKDTWANMGSRPFLAVQDEALARFDEISKNPTKDAVWNVLSSIDEIVVSTTTSNPNLLSEFQELDPSKFRLEIYKLLVGVANSDFGYDFEPTEFIEREPWQRTDFDHLVNTLVESHMMYASMEIQDQPTPEDIQNITSPEHLLELTDQGKNMEAYQSLFSSITEDNRKQFETEFYERIEERVLTCIAEKYTSPEKKRPLHFTEEAMSVESTNTLREDEPTRKVDLSHLAGVSPVALGEDGHYERTSGRDYIQNSGRSDLLEVKSGASSPDETIEIKVGSEEQRRLIAATAQDTDTPFGDEYGEGLDNPGTEVDQPIAEYRETPLPTTETLKASMFEIHQAAHGAQKIRKTLDGPGVYAHTNVTSEDVGNVPPVTPTPRPEGSAPLGLDESGSVVEVADIKNPESVSYEPDEITNVVPIRLVPKQTRKSPLPDLPTETDESTKPKYDTPIPTEPDSSLTTQVDTITESPAPSETIIEDSIDEPTPVPNETSFDDSTDVPSASAFMTVREQKELERLRRKAEEPDFDHPLKTGIDRYNKIRKGDVQRRTEQKKSGFGKWFKRGLVVAATIATIGMSYIGVDKAIDYFSTRTENTITQNDNNHASFDPTNPSTYNNRTEINGDASAEELAINTSYNRDGGINSNTDSNIIELTDSDLEEITEEQVAQLEQPNIIPLDEIEIYGSIPSGTNTREPSDFSIEETTPEENEQIQQAIEIEGSYASTGNVTFDLMLEYFRSVDPRPESRVVGQNNPLSHRNALNLAYMLAGWERGTEATDQVRDNVDQAFRQAGLSINELNSDWGATLRPGQSIVHKLVNAYGFLATSDTPESSEDSVASNISSTTVVVAPDYNQEVLAQGEHIQTQTPITNSGVIVSDNYDLEVQAFGEEVVTYQAKQYDEALESIQELYTMNDAPAKEIDCDANINSITAKHVYRTMSRRENSAAEVVEMYGLRDENHLESIMILTSLGEQFD